MDRPILFQGEMVRAILQGRKTQTRRVAKNVHFDPKYRAEWKAIRKHTEVSIDTPAAMLGEVCPYGQPGDRLWVRETWRTTDQWNDSSPRNIRHDAPLQYEATEPKRGGRSLAGRVRPSIHMPRWASRINLEITGVRVERLQDISEADAKAEGAQYFPDLPGKSPWGQDDRWSMEQPNSVDECLGSARFAFANYFCKLAGSARRGGDPRPWDANPWVWVIEFRRIN